MTVHASKFSWMIPPGKCVLIPATCPHSIRMWGRVDMRTLYFQTTFAPPYLCNEQCRVLSVSGLLRELILRILEMDALDSRLPHHQNLSAVLFAEISQAPEMPFLLPIPVSKPARSVALHLIEHSTSPETLDQLAKQYGAAKRTLERQFPNETGISFGLWRQKARLLNAVRLLAQDASVTNTALDCGYTSVSAFITAFKKTFGCTPSRFR